MPKVRRPLAIVHVVKFLKHRLLLGGRRLERVHLSGVGKEHRAARLGQAIDPHPRPGESPGQVQIVAIAKRRAGGLQLKTRIDVGQTWAGLDPAAAEIRVQRALGQVEPPRALAAALKPPKPKQVAAVHRFAAIGEGTVLVVAPVHLPGEAKLPKVPRANRVVRPALGRRQNRQQQTGQNGNDGDHDQQLHQRETGMFLSVTHLLRR